MPYSTVEPTLSMRVNLQDVSAWGWLPAASATPIPVQSARQWAEAADFHWHLAKTDKIRSADCLSLSRHLTAARILRTRSSA